MLVGSGSTLKITLSGTPCKIIDLIPNIKIQKYTSNYSTSDDIYWNRGNTQALNNVNNAHYIYLASTGYKFSSTNGGTILYSSTLNGSYSQVASITSSTSYTNTKTGYYSFSASNARFYIYGLNDSYFHLVNDLPKVTILSETTGPSGSTTHAGNKITINSGTTIFKPTITCNMTYDCGASLTLSRSTAQNGTYTQLSSYSLGSGGKHTSGTYNSLTSSYYYKLNGANSYVYLKDTAGSAVQF